ncbi:hypothetical protein [Myceligenerans indicum]|uniref:Uncharacterized protein n=1 Tax=Myceligenerans indicum TaxID=2593663 RepID=A0ABS1LQ36_9MICO|nr:hypothetical protein [Myceligenerans indicum]MBL0888350.1 hypothetical protein [Myceligenerans indicum]
MTSEHITDTAETCEPQWWPVLGFASTLDSGAEQLTLTAGRSARIPSIQGLVCVYADDGDDGDDGDDTVAFMRVVTGA